VSDPDPRRRLAFEGLRNVRDLGGYPGADGRHTRWGRVYRADSLAKLTEADEIIFEALGVGTVIDLRYDWEIAAGGRVRPGLFEYVNVSIEHRPYDQPSLGVDVAVVDFLGDRFAEVAEDGVVEIAAAIRLVARAPAAVVIHCTSGKDRTGLLAALLLGLVGVGDDDIVADFALTGLATDHLVADWRRSHPERASIWPGYGQAPPELMRRVLADLRARYGSIDGYARDALALSSEDLADLRAGLLTEPGDRRGQERAARPVNR
jgi:protein-tyrosine phosphatase